MDGHCGLHFTTSGANRARYTSGLTVYDEALVGSRWVGRYWMSAGFVHPERLLRWVEKATHTPYDISGLDMAAFGLELDGQSLHYGWQVVHMGEEPARRPGLRHAVVELHSSLRNVTVRVHTEVDGTGLLVRWLDVVNHEERPLALGACWPFSGLVARVSEFQPLLGEDGAVFEVGYMAERMWACEGAFEWQPLPSTPMRLESRIGRSGHSTPFFVVRNRATGEHLVGGLAWSANWAIELTAEQRAGSDAFLHLRLGPWAPAPLRVIAPGETISTPEVHLGWLQADLDGAIQAWHTHLRQSVMRSQVPGREWRIVLNHWGYVEQDMTEEQLHHEIDVAAEIGAEGFIIDAGWFGNKGTHWWRVAGDWQCGDKLPNGLEPIFAHARHKGLLYGMWVDLERLGSESRTAKEHPEWLMQRYGQPTENGDMDLTNPAAVAHIEQALCGLIDRYDMDIFRLDFNTFPLEGGQSERAGAGNSVYAENTQWRYVQNIYGLYERIAARYPRLIMENCAGGGGRTDIGMMARFHHVQATDWQFAPRAMRIVNGLTMSLPPEFVSRLPGVGQDGHQRADLDWQMRSSIFGHFEISGVYPGPGEGNAQHLARIRHYTDLYKTFMRPMWGTCRTYHHTPVLAGREPHGWAVLEWVAEDTARAAVGLFRLAGPAQETYHLQLRGVDPGRRYRVTFDNTGRTAELEGAALLYQGLDVRLERPLTSELLLLEAI